MSVRLLIHIIMLQKPNKICRPTSLWKWIWCTGILQILYQSLRSKRRDCCRVRFAGERGWGDRSTLPMIFLTPPSLRRFELLGVDSNPSVTDLSACDASTLLPVGDPPMFFFHKSVNGLLWCYRLFTSSYIYWIRNYSAGHHKNMYTHRNEKKDIKHSWKKHTHIKTLKGRAPKLLLNLCFYHVAHIILLWANIHPQKLRHYFLL